MYTRLCATPCGRGWWRRQIIVSKVVRKCFQTEERSCPWPLLLWWKAYSFHLFHRGFPGRSSVILQMSQNEDGRYCFVLKIFSSLTCETWQILSFFSLGVADFYVKPYTTSCQIIFYHTLLQTRMQVTGCFRQNAPDSPDSDPLA